MRGFSAKAVTEARETSSICTAITNNNLNELEAELVAGKGNAANVCLSTGETPLLFAILNKNAQAVRLLLKYGADISMKGIHYIKSDRSHSCSPVVAAVESEDVDTALVVLEETFDVHYIDNSKWEKLCRLAIKQHEEQLVELLTHKCELVDSSVYKTKDFNNEALYRMLDVASEEGVCSIANILLRVIKLNFDVEHTARLILSAAIRGHGEMCQLLSKHLSVDYDKAAVKLLVGAVKYSKYYPGNALEILYSLGCRYKNDVVIDIYSYLKRELWRLDDPKPNFHFGWGTILHLAIVTGNIQVVKCLIEQYGAPVGCVDTNGNSVLHLAALNRDAAMLKELIKQARAAKLDLAQLLAWRHHDHHVRYLTCERSVESVLHVIMSHSEPSLAVLEALCDAGVDWNVVSPTRGSVLHVALRCKQSVDIIRYCLDKCSHLINMRGPTSALMLAAEILETRNRPPEFYTSVTENQLRVVEMLITAGAILESDALREILYHKRVNYCHCHESFAELLVIGGCEVVPTSLTINQAIIRMQWWLVKMLLSCATSSTVCLSPYVTGVLRLPEQKNPVLETLLRLATNPPTLGQLSRRVVRQQLSLHAGGASIIASVFQLHYPVVLKQYLLLSDSRRCQIDAAAPHRYHYEFRCQACTKLCERENKKFTCCHWSVWKHDVEFDDGFDYSNGHYGIYVDAEHWGTIPHDCGHSFYDTTSVKKMM